MARKKAAETQVETQATQVETPQPEQPQAVKPPKRLFTEHRSSAFDIATGVQMTEFRSTEKNFPVGQYERRFYFRDGKPSDAVRQYMTQKGVKFGKHDKHADHSEPSADRGLTNPWYLTIPFDGKHARQIADQIFADVVSMMREEKGIPSAEVTR
jgi:hypothetical protein